MDRILETLRALFADIISIVSGRNGDDSIATQVLNSIKSLFGGKE